MGRKKTADEVADWLKGLSVFTYSIRIPGTILFNHTILEKTEPQANTKISKLYPGATYILVSSSKRITS